MRKDENEKSFLVKSIMVIFAILTVLSLIVSGCTSNSSENSKDSPIDSTNPNEQMEDLEVPVDNAQPTIKDQAIIAADNKPETQKTQEMIDQVIADGTYDEKVSYEYHSGTESIDISITVDNDVVTAASVTASPDAHKVSAKYIKGVDAALSELVIGKKINEIDFPKQISGSSLTTTALRKQLDNLIEKY